jgi:hypothetical protein
MGILADIFRYQCGYVVFPCQGMARSHFPLSADVDTHNGMGDAKIEIVAAE